MLGSLDHLAGLAMSVLPSGRKLFADGWGLEPDALVEHFRSAVDPAILSEPRPIVLNWGPWRPGTAGVKTREGTYPSPIEGLPEVLAVGRVLEVRPLSSGGARVSGQSTSVDERVANEPGAEERMADERVADERVAERCLLFGAWADEGWKKRLRIADRLASRGISTVIHETPFHGSRRLYPHGSPIRRVDEHALLTRITAVEGVGLLTALSPTTEHWVVAGFSMGASHAGAVLALSGRPLAGALFAVAHSPAIPFVDGVLRKFVSWSSLGGRPFAEAHLRQLLSSISLLSLDRPASPGRILLVGARHDAFVPSWAVEELAHSWAGARVEWRRGGHGSLYLFERDFMARTIAQRFPGRPSG